MIGLLDLILPDCYSIAYLSNPLGLIFLLLSLSYYDEWRITITLLCELTPPIINHTLSFANPY